MSCTIESSNDRRSAAIALLRLTRHSNSVVTPSHCVSKTAEARMAIERGRPSTAEVVGDSEHANPECVWGDEGPIND
jgi:hypothetical protein